MIDLSYIVDGLQQDVNEIIDWSDDLYASNFGMYFQDQKKYYDLLTSNKRPATDQELEDMLTTIPLQLFSAFEARSKFKITETIIRFKMKDKEIESISHSSYTSDSKKKEEAANNTIEYKFVLDIYGAILERVDREISYSRELIMACKKIWDSRRSTDASNPVSEVVPPEIDLPNYSPYKPNTYIK